MEQFLNKIKPLGISTPGFVLLIFLAFVPLFTTDQVLLQLLLSSLLYGVLAMGFDFTVGFINIVNFGYAAFWGAGAYTSALLAAKLGISVWIGVFAGMIFAGLLGFFTGALTLRFHGIFAAVVAWFTGLTLKAIVTNWTGLTRGPLGLMSPLLFGTVNRTPYFYVILAITVLSFIGLSSIVNSRIGLNFKAIGQDEGAAKASGVNPTGYRTLNFTISCALAGLVGGFYAHFVGMLSPHMMRTAKTVEIMAIAYIGGRGTLWGPLVASFLLIPSFEYLKPLMEIRLLVYGLLLIGVMVFYPGGLATLYKNVTEYLGKKLKWEANL